MTRMTKFRRLTKKAFISIQNYFFMTSQKH